MAASKKKIVTVLGEPQPKKSVTRYDAQDDEDAALANVYVRKAALEEIGNPDSIRVTIEAA